MKESGSNTTLQSKQVERPKLHNFSNNFTKLHVALEVADAHAVKETGHDPRKHKLKDHFLQGKTRR